jgi:Protein of unknown function (DUF2568)
MDVAKSINLALRFLLELCAVGAVGYWGFNTGHGTLAALVLGIGSPVLLILVWGAFIAPKAAVSLLEASRFVLGLVVLLVAAIALIAAGATVLGTVFGIVIIVNAVLLAVWKQ